jgi:hypothetical protein
MSIPFTNPYDIPAGQTWQTLLDEITLAYSERINAYGWHSYTPSDGKDVQAATYWAVFQNWVETNCVSFVDHVSGPLNPTGTEFLYFTLETFREEAGLNESGFRRVPEGVEWDGVNDPVWSYGVMQEGDIIGPWIFEDLQKGFGALKWVCKGGLFLMGRTVGGGYFIGADSDCATNRASHASQLAAATFEEITLEPVNAGIRELRVYADVIGGVGGYWWSYQEKLKARYSRVYPWLCPYFADLYFYPTTAAPYQFFDFTGLGLTEGVHFLYESLPESTDIITQQSDWIGENLVNGFDTLGWYCPSAGRYAKLRLEPRWIVKPSFTNA